MICYRSKDRGKRGRVPSYPGTLTITSTDLYRSHHEGRNEYTRLEPSRGLMSSTATKTVRLVAAVLTITAQPGRR